MSRTLISSDFRKPSLSVSNWLNETHAGKETRYLCVNYDHFGFGMSLKQVEEAIRKLDALLTSGEIPSADGEIQIDRSGATDGFVMIAFRPAANHSARYFDFPEDAARSLLETLNEKIRAIGVEGYPLDDSTRNMV
jgi:hypothetical protein